MSRVSDRIGTKVKRRKQAQGKTKWIIPRERRRWAGIKVKEDAAIEVPVILEEIPL